MQTFNANDGEDRRDNYPPVELEPKHPQENAVLSQLDKERREEAR